jgi:hypothetical protein
MSGWEDHPRYVTRRVNCNGSLGTSGTLTYDDIFHNLQQEGG